MRLTTLQVDPGMKDFSIYTVTLHNDVLLGLVLVARTSYEGYEAGYEYWSLTADGMEAVGESESMKWNGVSDNWSQLPSTGWPGEDPLPMFRTPALVEWLPIDAPHDVFATQAENNATLGFALTYEDDEWGGELNWGQTGRDEFVIKVGLTSFLLTADPTGEPWTGVTTVPDQL